MPATSLCPNVAWLWPFRCPLHSLPVTYTIPPAAPPVPSTPAAPLLATACSSARACKRASFLRTLSFPLLPRLISLYLSSVLWPYTFLLPARGGTNNIPLPLLAQTFYLSVNSPTRSACLSAAQNPRRLPLYARRSPRRSCAHITALVYIRFALRFHMRNKTACRDMPVCCVCASPSPHAYYAYTRHGAGAYLSGEGGVYLARNLYLFLLSYSLILSGFSPP